MCEVIFDVAILVAEIAYDTSRFNPTTDPPPRDRTSDQGSECEAAREVHAAYRSR